MALITSHFFFDLIVLLLASISSLYLYFKIKFRYWNGRGFPMAGKPSFPLGHFTGMYSQKCLSDTAAGLYFKMKHERFFAGYFLKNPIVFVNDPELIKDILIKNFSSFHDRGFEINPANDPLLDHLFVVGGQEWRNLRIKLTPTFTSGKMKMMFPILIEIGNELIKVLENCAKTETETEIKDILSRYTTDVISSCAFGLETNSLKNPDAEFRKMGASVTKPTIMGAIANILLMISPKILDYFRITIIPKHINKFFIGAVEETMKFRTDNNVNRKDFLQLLIELREKGFVADTDGAKANQSGDNSQKFTLEKAAAQAFVFFVAGFETSSSTLQYALYELALNPDIQKNLQKEIDEKVNKHGGNITFEALQEMSLLDNVVSETLRKYPVGGFVVRSCNSDYKIPNSNAEIRKGELVWITMFGLHHDPRYFPDPEKFIPDRFLPEEKAKRHPYSYIPFGEGPRSCIGNRFGLMQVKTALAIILSNFNVEPSSKTLIPMVFDPKSDIIAPKEKLHLKISVRETK